MSDLMLLGVLRMPYNMAMGDELSRLQFHARAHQAADRIEQLEKRVAALEDVLEAAEDITEGSPIDKVGNRDDDSLFDIAQRVRPLDPHAARLLVSKGMKLQRLVRAAK